MKVALGRGAGKSTVPRILETGWPTLLVGSACMGIALSVWVRPPVGVSAPVAARGARGIARGPRHGATRPGSGRAGVRRTVVGRDPRRGTRPELPRRAHRAGGPGQGCRHGPGSQDAVRVACPGRGDPVRSDEHPRARAARAPAGACAAAGRRPRAACATGRAAWARDRLRRARLARAPRRPRRGARGACARRRPAGRDRWRRRPVARARRGHPGPWNRRGAPAPARRDRARRGLGRRSRARGCVPCERPHAPARGVGTERRDHRRSAW